MVQNLTYAINQQNFRANLSRKFFSLALINGVKVFVYKQCRIHICHENGLIAYPSIAHYDEANIKFLIVFMYAQVENH